MVAAATLGNLPDLNLDQAEHWIAAALAEHMQLGELGWLALVLMMTPALGLFYAGLVREKNTLNLVRVGEDRVRITHYMYFDELLGFAPISRHVFPRPGRRFLAEMTGEVEEGISLGRPLGVPHPEEIIPDAAQDAARD